MVDYWEKREKWFRESKPKIRLFIRGSKKMLLCLLFRKENSSFVHLTPLNTNQRFSSSILLTNKRWLAPKFWNLMRLKGPPSLLYFHWKKFTKNFRAKIEILNSGYVVSTYNLLYLKKASYVQFHRLWPKICCQSRSSDWRPSKVGKVFCLIWSFL